MINLRKTADLEKDLGELLSDGFRLEMIFPADSPRVAELSRGDERIRIETDSPQQIDGEWHVGRAGMEYRDLIPGRLGGKLIASHIRIPCGGLIPDYVHYHNVDFQIIYCLSGRARLVYEDQGEPFWFEAGDCVLQPPTIRHRVLECSDGFEVFEAGSPAEHPTFAEHGFDLPKPSIDRGRVFGGQRFVHHRVAEAKIVESEGIARRETGIRDASAGAGDVLVISSERGGSYSGLPSGFLTVAFVARGAVSIGGRTFAKGDAIVLNEIEVALGAGTELIVVAIGG